LAAWLLTITRHRSLDALRKMRRDQSTALEATAGTWAMTAAPALDALGDLTVEQREVIHLRFVEDQTIEDIARITGRSQAAVKSLQHRALRQLRARIEKNKAGGTASV
jgi:RNA polymerase sigma-70 factor (ECF subfamily)